MSTIFSIITQRLMDHPCHTHEISWSITKILEFMGLEQSNPHITEESRDFHTRLMKDHEDLIARHVKLRKDHKDLIARSQRQADLTLRQAKRIREQGEPCSSSPKGKRPPAPPPPVRKQPTTRAIVVRALPTKYKVGELRRWIKEDNKDLVITGACWLLTEDRRPGKTHSSLVLYLADSPETPRLRMGRKSFHTTAYDWDRPPRSQPRP